MVKFFTQYAPVLTVCTDVGEAQVWYVFFVGLVGIFFNYWFVFQTVENGVGFMLASGDCRHADHDPDSGV
jgi:hypothetical protein